MRWRKVEGQRCRSLDRRGYRLVRVRIRRYSKWRGNRCKWIIIVDTMDVWVKRRVHVAGREEGGEGEGHGDVLNRVDREWECDFGTSKYRNHHAEWDDNS